MDIALFIISGILVILGFIGCIVPIIPGVPLSLVGLLLLHFTDAVEFTSTNFILFIVLTIIAQASDYMMPIWFTKKFGGSKWGVWGSTIGLLAGFFFGIFGIILGPIIGAITGELLSGKRAQDALKAGFGSFVGFLFNTGFKMMVCGYFIWIFFKNIWN